MAKIAIGCRREISQPDCLKALLAEFIATFLFIFAGVGSAITADNLVGNPVVALFVVAAAHTFVVAAMVSASFHISGGHLNPAVTLGLAVGGHITLLRSALYWIVQLLASSAACFSLRYSTGLATPIHSLGNGISSVQGVAMEVVLTFALVFTVYGTIVDANKATPNGLGPILVGLVVGANILAGGSFSGASMNPARSFGPAIVMGAWSDHWVYWVGPLFGSVIAGFLYEKLFTVKQYVVQQQPPEEDEDLLHY